MGGLSKGMIEPYAYFSKIILVALWQQWKQGEPWDNANEAMAFGAVLVSKLFTICNKISMEIAAESNQEFLFFY